MRVSLFEHEKSTKHTYALTFNQIVGGYCPFQAPQRFFWGKTHYNHFQKYEIVSKIQLDAYVK